MNRSETEQLTDEIIGEAVLSLLKEKGPINFKALLSRLRAMEAKEADNQRRKAISSVIAEISARMLAGQRNNLRENKEWTHDNVHSLFEKSQKSDASKKH